MQQTAVEFLELCFIRNASISLDEWKTARQMIKQQIKDAFDEGNPNGFIIKDGEQYYNETYEAKEM
jgi:hypothetical protein